jgi:hypothetical protein
VQLGDLDIYKSLTPQEKGVINDLHRRLSENVIDQAEREDDRLPAVLYHYTDGDGLLGILRDARIRATHISYLNDRSELLHLLETFVDLTRKHRELIADENLTEFLSGVEQAFEQLLERMPEIVQTFVSCFCVSRDLLSQWRGYSNARAGYALGFQFARIREVTHSNRLTLAPCVYDRDFQVTVAKRFLDLTINVYLPGRTRFDPKGLAVFRDDLLKVAFNGLIWGGVMLKNASFREEREWRIFTHKRRQDVSEIKFSARLTGLSQYVEFPISEPAGQLPLQEILVGPSRDQVATSAAVENLLLQLGYANVAVIPSSVPLRVP